MTQAAFWDHIELRDIVTGTESSAYMIQSIKISGNEETIEMTAVHAYVTSYVTIFFLSAFVIVVVLVYLHLKYDYGYVMIPNFLSLEMLAGKYCHLYYSGGLKSLIYPIGIIDNKNRKESVKR